jgi:hypothetical protein
MTPSWSMNVCHDAHHSPPRSTRWLGRPANSPTEIFKASAMATATDNTSIRRRLLDGLTELWEAALAERRALAPRSPVAVLDRLLTPGREGAGE